LGSASIGILGKDCVVIISDRRQKDVLIIEDSANKINEIDEHIIAVSAGITSDARVLVEKARMSSQQHRMTYDSAPITESVIRDVADIQQQFTQYGGVRPFGVSMMFGGYNGEPVLYTVDITGNYLKYKANAIGENDEKIKKLLKERYTKDLSSREAIKLGLDIFKEVQGENFSIDKFDVGIVKEGKIEKLQGKELEIK
ncbi:hypothetical protein KAI32_01825, partial [Candidatus Pacearchaeota archaeon]|nr:hypothetical protein [Candidatus Pacearchaeota archaeon]